MLSEFIDDECWRVFLIEVEHLLKWRVVLGASASLEYSKEAVKNQKLIIQLIVTIFMQCPTLMVVPTTHLEDAYRVETLTTRAEVVNIIIKVEGIFSNNISIEKIIII